MEYDLAFSHFVIAELEFLNERSEFRNSSSAIQVTMKTKNSILYFVINNIILDCG
ncbi:MAG: hypothetical protein LBG48_05310 [Rickettsiales bacterium]|nr:hypothetical protein [Rickettsiales bacterium]